MSDKIFDFEIIEDIEETKMGEIIDFISQIGDTRCQGKIKHKLTDIVILTLLAMLANVEYWTQVEDFGNYYERILKKYLELPNGIPSHDTIQRVISTISPEAMQGVVNRWNRLLGEKEDEKLKKIFNIDGKTMRGSKNKDKEALHVMTAYSQNDRVCYSQETVEGKGREIAGIMQLLENLKIRNCIITIDAIGTQKKIVEKIAGEGGDYCLALKKNQQDLYEDVSEYMNDRDFQRGMKYYKTVEKARGGIETREYYMTDKTKWLNKRHTGWKKLKGIGMCKLSIEKGGEVTSHTRYYIMSITEEISEFARAVRGHWEIESLHWVLDVVFREDSNRTLNRTAAKNLNILRKLSINILKELTYRKENMSYKRKRLAVSMDFRNFLMQIFKV